MRNRFALSLRIEHKFAEIIQKQEEVGVRFATDKAKKHVVFLQQEMDRLYSEIRPFLTPEVVTKGAPVKKPFKKSGEPTKMAMDWIENADLIAGPFSRVQFLEPDLNKQEKLKQQLLNLGWEPDEYTPVTEKGGGNNPKITESSLDKLESGLGKSIALWTKLRHRQSQIQGWIDNVREDGRISAKVNPCATNTARVAHKIVANVPKANNKDGQLLYYPEGDVLFGTEMRELFTVGPGRKLVGCDAAGLEARILAHYMHDSWFTRELLEGDIHTKMWESCDPWVDTRSTMKNCFYAFVFSAGYFRLGVTAGYPVDKAAEAGYNISEGIKWALPALAELNENVQRAAQRGYLKTIDGRKIWMRKKEGKLLTHKALNTIIQSAGSIICKSAACFADHEFRKQGKDAIQTGYWHDELMIDSREGDVEEVAKISEEAFKKAGEYFKLRVPIEGDAHIGDNWAQIH